MAKKLIVPIISFKDWLKRILIGVSYLFCLTQPTVPQMNLTHYGWVLRIKKKHGIKKALQQNSLQMVKLNFDFGLMVDLFCLKEFVKGFSSLKSSDIKGNSSSTIKRKMKVIAQSNTSSHTNLLLGLSLLVL